MPTYKLIVMTNAVAGQDAAFNSWYDDRHAADVLALPGFVAMQRFEAESGMAEVAPTHRYLAIYDLDTDDVGAAMAGLFDTAGTDRMEISPAMADDVQVALYRARADRVIARA